MKKIILGLILILKLVVAEGTIMIEVAYENDTYKINRAWKIRQTFPTTSRTYTQHESDIIIEIKDNDNRVVDTMRIENPNIVRGIISENNSEEGHQNFTKNKGIFIIRYPYSKNLSALHISTVQKDIGISTSSNEEIKLNQNDDLNFKHFL